MLTVEEASNYFKLIADPNRLVILRLLTSKLHMCANEFLKSVTCKQATLSHHLSEMTESGLLNSKKSGNKVMYSINASKYEQLITFLGRIERINKTINNPIRVVDSKLINKEPNREKEELPTFLL